eukprot:gene3915-biopygen3222
MGAGDGDGVEGHAPHPARAQQLSDRVLGAAHGPQRRTQHALSNCLIEVNGDTARAETYCQAFHELDGEGDGLEMVVGGRYLDDLERRDGAWRILHRTYVMDWNRNTVSTCRWDEGIYAGLKIRGARWPDDPLQAFLRG